TLLGLGSVDHGTSRCDCLVAGLDLALDESCRHFLLFSLNDKRPAPVNGWGLGDELGSTEEVFRPSGMSRDRMSQGWSNRPLWTRQGFVSAEDSTPHVPVGQCPRSVVEVAVF